MQRAREVARSHGMTACSIASSQSSVSAAATAAGQINGERSRVTRPLGSSRMPGDDAASRAGFEEQVNVSGAEASAQDRLVSRRRQQMRLDQLDEHGPVSPQVRIGGLARHSDRRANIVILLREPSAASRSGCDRPPSPIRSTTRPSRPAAAPLPGSRRPIHRDSWFRCP